MKKKIKIFALILLLAFIIISAVTIKNMPPDIIQDRRLNVYEGQFGNIPTRIMICRNGKKLNAYYIGKDDKPEQSLTGIYHRITKKFQLENDNHTISLSGSTYEDRDNNDLIVLKGKLSEEKGKQSETFCLTPVWGFTGCDRKNLYSELGYDTKQAEEFTDYIIELISKNDGFALSKLVSYPLVVYGKTGQLTINSEQEFQSQFDEVMPRDFKNAVAQSFRRYLFANYMGINFGDQNGFWFSPGTEENVFKIKTIFNTSGNYKEEIPADNNRGIEKG